MDKDNKCVTKLLDDFRSGGKFSSLNYRSSSSRMSGAFPLPFEVIGSTPVLGPKDPSKRPFDESLLNQNDYLIKRKKRKSLEDSANSDLMNDTNVLASPWEIRRIKSELVEAKAEIIALEARITQLHGLRKETELLFEQEKSSLKMTIERDRNTIRDLETRVKILKKREEKLRDDLANTLVNFNQEKLTLENKVMELREEQMSTVQKLSEVESGKSEVVRELSAAKTELSSLRRELDSSREQVEALTTQMLELRRVARQYEIDKNTFSSTQIKLSELEYELKTQAETAAHLKSQQTKLFRYGDLERQVNTLTQENAKLRQSTSNTMYLEGEVEDLKSRLSLLEEREKELMAVRVEMGMLKSQLDEYKRVSDEILGKANGGPSALATYLRELHSSHLLATSQQSQLQAKLKTAAEDDTKIKTEIKRLMGEMDKLKTELEQTNISLRRIKKQNTLIIWERNDLRSLVDSCQREVTMTVSSVDPRIEALEKLVEGYRRRMEQIEEDPQIAKVDASPGSKGTVSNAEMEALKKERDELAAKIEKLEFEMEHRALKGDFNAQDVKILHFKLNPTAEAVGSREDALEAAHAELDRLRQRVKLLQEGQLADITQTIETKLEHVSTKELEELREQVKTQKLQNQRLKDAFKATGHEFREAIFNLFGYKVDALPSKVYRLSSLYAEAPDHHLIFKMKQDSSMEMLETEFSTTVGELIEEHLCHNHSIPVFLSSLTIDLFQRQTHLSTTFSNDMSTTMVQL